MNTNNIAIMLSSAMIALALLLGLENIHKRTTYTTAPTMTPEMSCEGGVLTFTNIPRDEVKTTFGGMLAINDARIPEGTTDASKLNVGTDTEPTNILNGNLSGI
jgi:hypothetical protein